jgi:hypothetical protein
MSSRHLQRKKKKKGEGRECDESDKGFLLAGQNPDIYILWVSHRLIEEVKEMREMWSQLLSNGLN